MRNLKEIEGAGKKTRKKRAGRARPTLYTQALTPDRPPQAEITGSSSAGGGSSNSSSVRSVSGVSSVGSVSSVSSVSSV